MLDLLLVREQIFMSNLAVINTQNALYSSGLSSFFLSVNQYSDLRFDEFVSQTVGVGLFRKRTVDTSPPVNASKGVLPVSPAPRYSVDYSQGSCNSRIRRQECNSCSAHSAISAVEYCLCLAGEDNLPPR